MGFPVVEPRCGFFNFNDAIHLRRFENRRLLLKNVFQTIHNRHKNIKNIYVSLKYVPFISYV